METEAKQVAANLARESDDELRELIRQDWESVKERKAQAETSLTTISQTENRDLVTLIEQAIRHVENLRSLSADDESRRRIGETLKRLNVWIDRDFEAPDFGKRKVRRLKGGQISIGHYGLPAPLRGGNATRQQTKLAAAASSTKAHRDDRI